MKTFKHNFKSKHLDTCKYQVKNNSVVQTMFWSKRKVIPYIQYIQNIMVINYHVQNQ